MPDRAHDDLFRHDDADRLGHLLWEVSAHTSQLSEAALAGTPLTPATSGILDVIAANPGTSIAELARRLPTSAQGVSQLVGKLEKSGYLERRLGGRGHGIALYITNAGEAARLDAGAIKMAQDAELAKTLGQRNYAQLVRLLKQARPLVAELATRRRSSR